MAELVRGQEQQVPFVKTLLLRAQAALGIRTVDRMNGNHSTNGVATAAETITAVPVITMPTIETSTQPQIQRVSNREAHAARTMRLQAEHIANHWGVTLPENVIQQYVAQRQTNGRAMDQELLSKIMRENNIEMPIQKPIVQPESDFTY